VGTTNGGGRRTRVTLALAGLLVVAVAATGCLDLVERTLYGVRPGVTLAGRDMTGQLPHEARRTVKDLARELWRPPENATIDRSTGKVVPERPGQVLDVAETVRRVLEAGPGEAVEPLLLPVEPRVNREALARATVPLGRYSTWLSGSAGRIHNIRLGASLLNHTVLLPGEIFSFWAAHGPTTAARGFKKAPVIIGEAFVTDLGGGVCQVSTTLYNAALEAGLEIVQRHPHSKRVWYVPIGRDAAVSFDWLDLKFRNTTDYPLVIRGGTGGGRVWFEILGPPEAALPPGASGQRQGFSGRAVESR